MGSASGDPVGAAPLPPHSGFHAGNCIGRIENRCIARAPHSSYGNGLVITPSPLVSSTCTRTSRPPSARHAFRRKPWCRSSRTGPPNSFEIHRLVGVVVELQMMCGITSVDQSELFGYRIVEKMPGARCCASGTSRRILIGRIAAPRRVRVAADLRRHPDAALAVHHGIVRVGRIVGGVGPQVLALPPKQGWAIGRGEARRNLIPGFARQDIERDRAALSS